MEVVFVMNEKKQINLFFEILADRFHNENSFSDVTYILCNINEEFRKYFLSYCFDEKLNTDDLQREFFYDFSRPDFYFHDLSGKEKIIEVKIFDKNQHFEQYQKDFPNADYSFIANYDYGVRDNFL